MNTARKLFLLLFLTCTVPALATETTSQIQVSGLGKINAPPDMAHVEFSFSERATTAAPAREKVDQDVARLLALGTKLQIKEEDIQASRLQIQPEYDYKQDRRLIGYRVTRDVRITLRDLDDYAQLLDGSVKIGVTSSGNLQLDFSNRDQLENQAMLAAFDKAREKAQLLAAQAGGKLGAAVWISESGGFSPPPPVPMRMMAAEAADASYPTGHHEISKQVEVRFTVIATG